MINKTHYARPVMLAVLLLLVVGGFMHHRQTAAKQCGNCQNVILISIDTLGAKYLGTYGKNPSLTPTIDAFIKKYGVVFEQAYSQAPWTLPSHTAMLTGEYPQDLNVERPTDALPQSAITLAESLKADGYHTGAVSYGAFVHKEWGFNQGYDDFIGDGDTENWEDTAKIYSQGEGWINKQDQKQPYHLFLHSFAVHDPYFPTDDNIQPVTVTDLSDANKSYGSGLPEANTFRTAYESQLPRLDNGLGGFLEFLEQKGVLKNTTVIITSDHGEEFGEHGWVGVHGAQLYNETLHVPLVVFSPGLKPTRVAGAVEVRSIPATILDLVHAPNKSVFSAPSLFTHSNHTQSKGVAFSSTSLDTSAYKNLEQNYMQIEQLGVTFTPIVRNDGKHYVAQRSVRSLKWSVVYHQDGRYEIYDLLKDPQEKNDLSRTMDKLSRANPELKQMLAQVIANPGHSK